MEAALRWGLDRQRAAAKFCRQKEMKKLLPTLLLIRQSLTSVWFGGLIFRVRHIFDVHSKRRCGRRDASAFRACFMPHNVTRMFFDFLVIRQIVPSNQQHPSVAPNKFCAKEKHQFSPLKAFVT